MSSLLFFLWFPTFIDFPNVSAACSQLHQRLAQTDYYIGRRGLTGFPPFFLFLSFGEIALAPIIVDYPVNGLMNHANIAPQVTTPSINPHSNQQERHWVWNEARWSAPATSFTSTLETYIPIKLVQNGVQMLCSCTVFKLPFSQTRTNQSTSGYVSINHFSINLDNLGSFKSLIKGVSCFNDRSSQVAFILFKMFLFCFSAV